MKKKMFGALAATIAAVQSSPALAANTGLCDLISKMHDVFQTLRVLAFLGAAFIIASWAWTFIKGGGGDGKTSVVDELKTKGISLLVGFALLFGIGVALSFLMSGQIVDCAEVLTKW